jgi:Septum formation
MRRWMAPVLALFVASVLFVASGCSAEAPTGAPPVTTTGAPPVTTATEAPAAPSSSAAPLLCHAEGLAPTGSAPTGAVDCAAAHRTQTVHVGEFAAGVATVPAAGTPPLRAAYDDCDERAAGYVGGDWRTARLRLGVVVPSVARWADGARWYRCDLEEISLIGPDAESVERRGDLAGALEAVDSPLLLRCHRMEIDQVRKVINVPAVPCEKAHNGEFVGLWKAPDRPFPSRTEDFVPFYDGCRAEIGRYVGVPLDKKLVLRADVVPVFAQAPDWKAGDRGVRCYLYLNDRELTGSLKGKGDAGLPVRGRT